MALRLSTGIRNYMLQHGSVKHALQNGQIEVYSGTQPATADAAITGTLLCTYTKSSAARTAEVLASGTITLTGTTGGVATVTVNGVNIIPQGAVPFNTSLTQTAADLATAINAGLSTPEYVATSAVAVVTIKAMRGTGAGPNTFAVAGTYTGDMGGTYAAMSGGVTPVNGLTLASSAAGVISKTASEVWTGVAAATGTAGWMRFVGSVADAGGLDTTESVLRVDGSVAVSGAQLNLSSTSMTSGATQTISSFSITMPAA